MRAKATPARIAPASGNTTAPMKLCSSTSARPIQPSSAMTACAIARAATSNQCRRAPGTSSPGDASCSTAGCRCRAIRTRPSDERDERRHRPADADVLAERAGPGDREVAPPERDERDSPPTTKNAAPRSSAIDSRDSALAAGCRSTREIDDDSVTRHPVRSCDRLGAVASPQHASRGRSVSTMPAMRHDASARMPRHPLTPGQESVGSSTSSIEPCTNPPTRRRRGGSRRGSRRPRRRPPR